MNIDQKIEIIKSLPKRLLKEFVELVIYHKKYNQTLFTSHELNVRNISWAYKRIVPKLNKLGYSFDLDEMDLWEIQRDFSKIEAISQQKDTKLYCDFLWETHILNNHELPFGVDLDLEEKNASKIYENTYVISGFLKSNSPYSNVEFYFAIVSNNYDFFSEKVSVKCAIQREAYQQNTDLAKIHCLRDISKKVNLKNWFYPIFL